MEGCDGEKDGSPGELSIRRYKRFAAGGAGIIWIEATAVTSEGRANPRQFWINEDSLPKFKHLIEIIKENALNHKGENHKPYLVLQLTHSGRYCKPLGVSTPIIAYRSPVLKHQENSVTKIITDNQLDKLKEKFVVASQMAQECGVDAIDIKSCHGYLLYELLSAYTRENSRYGGSFENRTRFLRETIQEIKKHIYSIDVTTRLSFYDGTPYPYGWGMKQDNSLLPDMTEPIALVEKLQNLGVNMLNLTAGNPYYNPHISRPYDVPVKGGYIPVEHPLISISRIIDLTYQLSEKFPSLFIINTGFSWLRQYSVLVGAKMKKDAKVGAFGLGRLAFAYPNLPNEFLKDKQLTRNQLCIACSCCSQIMRDGGKTGCVVRDKEVYRDIYKKGQSK